jgi:hypothetical protein
MTMFRTNAKRDVPAHVLIAWLAAAAAAVAVPLVDAQVEALDQYAQPLPESGRWFANDGTRTGFFIEVQNGIVAGLYVGSDAQGDNAWLSFSGSLAPGATTGGEGVWILESDLLRFAGTGCIVDCSAAVDGESSYADVGDIRIDFRGSSAGTVWIDDRPAVEIAPIYFGVERVVVNENDPPLFLPDLEGQWVVAAASSADFPERYLDAAVIEVGERRREGVPTLTPPPGPVPVAREVFPIISDPDGLFAADSTIVCTIYRPSTVEPFCGVEYQLGPMASFAIDFDSISDARFTVLEVSDLVGSSVQYQLFRLNHD